MRVFFTIFFVLLFGSSLWISGCATRYASGSAERVIDAGPVEIMIAVGRSLEADGLERISRSDSGDIYQAQLTASDLEQHPMLAEIARDGAMTLRARVSRSEIEFTSSFPNSDSAVGFTVTLTPAADGNGTLARLQPLVRGGEAAEDQDRLDALRRSFAGRGEALLAGIARASEI